MTRKIRLFILHSFVVVYTNYCSHFVEKFKVKFFLPEIAAIKILQPISLSIPLFNKQSFASKQKRQRNMKKYPDSFYVQSLRVNFDFSTKWCNQGEENLECAGSLSNIFRFNFELNVLFQSILSFLFSTFGIINKDCYWTVSLISPKTCLPWQKNRNRSTRSPRLY